MTHAFKGVFYGAVAKTNVVGAAARHAQYHRALALPDTQVTVQHSRIVAERIDVSIVIPCYNYAAFLEKAVASASAVSRLANSPQIEIIIFEDRSQDESFKVASRLLQESSIPFVVIRPPWNVGLSRARNIGLHHARGKYLFYLDADNTLNPEGLLRLFQVAEEEHSDAAYGPIQIIWPDGKRDGLLSARAFDELWLRRNGNYIDAMALFRRASLVACGGYDVDLLRTIGGWEDYELWLRMAVRGQKISFCEGILIGEYLSKQDSMVQQISLKECAEAFRRLGTAVIPAGTRRDEALVFDLGFHKGEDTSYYLDMGYRVVAVEADGTLYEKGLQRFQEDIKNGRLVLIHAAVVGWKRALTTDTILFYPHPTNTVWGSVDQTFVDRNAVAHKQPHAPPVEVRTTTLERLVQEHGCPFFLKVDIEGMDAEVVNDVERLPVQPAYVSWETGKRKLRKVLATHLKLYFIGYGRFRIVQQMNNRKKHYRQPDTGFLLPFGADSSGPMPALKPGAWNRIGYVIVMYLLLFALYRLFGPYSLCSWAEERSPHAIGRALRRMRSGIAESSIPLPGWFDTHAALCRRQGRLSE